MKFPKSTYSFAHAAHEMDFPGGAPNFIYWLRHHKYLSAELEPHPVCLTLGLFVNHVQEIPGLTRNQRDQVVIPRITAKGLDYFISSFNQAGHIFLDPLSTTPLLP